MKTSFSVIIPSYNALGLLKKNIPAVLRAANDRDEVLVVDDAGSDGSAEWLINTFKLTKEFDYSFQVPKNYFTQFTKNDFDLYTGEHTRDTKVIFITLIILKENMRFAGAVNSAVLLAKNNYLFLCNNDVYPEESCFTHLRPLFEADTTLFAVGCLEYEDSKAGSKSGKNKLWFSRGLFWHSKADSFESGETAWASGGSAVFDKAKWLELYGFDSAYYPAYWEDIDISFRARKKGWKILFEEKAVVFHKHESTHQTVFGRSKIQKISWRNSQIFTWKNSDLKQKIQFLLWWPYWSYIRILQS